MNTLNTWFQVLKKIISIGDHYQDSDDRSALELENLIIKIENPEADKIEGPIDLMTNSKEWLYPSKAEISNIIFKTIQNPSYDYTYGGRIFNYQKSINQLENYIIPLLQKNPQSRAAIVTIIDPLIDFESAKRNLPGITTIYFRIRNNKLNITATIRSQDMLFGWPANLYQLYCLQKFVAKDLDMEIGSITTISHSAHIFKINKEQILKMVENEK